MPASPPSRFPPNATLSTAGRVRRAEYRRDNLGALAQNVSLAQRAKQRDEFISQWCAWIRQRMDAAECDDPTELLPDICARLEKICEDRIATAFKQFKTELKG